ncbi:hypothetical protein FS837_012639 [Tulasnella sp. UAMH 9824]|nr:hypothetical protein FS837_012639 [Tulasnella sp. UAMH 9824]
MSSQGSSLSPAIIDVPPVGFPYSNPRSSSADFKEYISSLEAVSAHEPSADRPVPVPAAPTLASSSGMISNQAGLQSVYIQADARSYRPINPPRADPLTVFDLLHPPLRPLHPLVSRTNSALRDRKGGAAKGTTIERQAPPHFEMNLAPEPTSKADADSDTLTVAKDDRFKLHPRVDEHQPYGRIHTRIQDSREGGCAHHPSSTACRVV